MSSKSPEVLKHWSSYFWWVLLNGLNCEVKESSASSWWVSMEIPWWVIPDIEASNLLDKQLNRLNQKKYRNSKSVPSKKASRDQAVTLWCLGWRSCFSDHLCFSKSKGGRAFAEAGNLFGIIFVPRRCICLEANQHEASTAAQWGARRRRSSRQRRGHSSLHLG